MTTDDRIMETTGQNIATHPGRSFINKKQLLEKIPLSYSTIRGLEIRGAFPKRFAITTNRVAWDLAEVEKWMEERKASGDPLPEQPARKKVA